MDSSNNLKRDDGRFNQIEYLNQNKGWSLNTEGRIFNPPWEFCLNRQKSEDVETIGTDP